MDSYLDIINDILTGIRHFTNKITTIGHHEHLLDIRNEFYW